SQFRVLETRFDHYPLQPIIVILYPQRQFYEATQADSNVAGLYDGKIRVPIGGLQQLDAEARHVLVHELAHAFIAGKSHGTAPRWLHEGLAQSIEGKSTGTATGVALAKEFEALADKETWGQEFSYPSALSFVEYLDERPGFPALLDVLEAMAKGDAAEAAFEKVTRYSLEELRQARGVVTDEQLRRATAAKLPEELLGTTITRLGLITKETLDELTREHIHRVVVGALSMRDGQYEFRSGALPFREQLDGGLSTPEIL